MATLSPPPRFNSESLRGLRSTIDDLRSERETLDRFLDESFHEFEELAEELSQFDEELQKSREALHQEQQAFIEERDRLQSAAARCQELERLLEKQNDVIATLRDDLTKAQTAKSHVEQQLVGAAGDMNAAAELVDVVHTWSNELAEVARRLRERGTAISSLPPLNSEKQEPLAPSEVPGRENSKGKTRTLSNESKPKPTVETSGNPELLEPEEATVPVENAKAKQASPKGGKSLDPVVGSVLAQLAELERATDDNGN